jgi:membrane-bound ClpP family serine protease
MALIITLIVLGIILLLVELLLIPGFGVTGILGIVALVGGVVMAYYTRGATTGHIVLCGAILCCALLLWYALRSSTWKRLALHDNITAQAFDKPEDKGVHVGMKGISVTRLAPIGTVLFDHVKIEATAYEGIINSSRPVEVVKIDGIKVIVKEETY